MYTNMANRKPSHVTTTPIAECTDPEEGFTKGRNIEDKVHCCPPVKEIYLKVKS